MFTSIWSTGGARVNVFMHNIFPEIMSKYLISQRSIELRKYHWVIISDVLIERFLFPLVLILFDRNLKFRVCQQKLGSCKFSAAL